MNQIRMPKRKPGLPAPVVRACRWLQATLILLAIMGAWSAPAATNKPTLTQAMAELKVPPPWLDAVPLDVPPGTPWNKAWDRIEVLLMTADPADRRKAIKLAYVYQVNGQARDGMPAATYFLAGETAWALAEHEKINNKNSSAWIRLAACYRHFGEHTRALAALEAALQQLPDPPWREFEQARIYEYEGDLRANLDDRPRAKAAYLKARRICETIPPKPPLQLPASRAIARLAAKTDLLDRDVLKSATLRDGTYSAVVFGYSDNIRAHVTVRAGRIADVKLEHREKADLGARTIMPERIVREQRVDVDGITGATVTSEAIKTAVFQALKQAAGM